MIEFSYIAVCVVFSLLCYTPLNKLKHFTYLITDMIATRSMSKFDMNELMLKMGTHLDKKFDDKLGPTLDKKNYSLLGMIWQKSLRM